MKSFVASAVVVLSSALMAQAASQNHIVSVGAGGALEYSPNNVVAAVGDTITFQFLAGNHSVAQSTFAAPCVPINGVWSGFEFVGAAASSSSAAGAAATTTAGGYSSGYKEKRASTVPEFTITVNNTSPLWFYCAQAQHCQKGMVMAVNVNATTNKTLDAFKTAAASAASNIAPTFNAQGGIQSSGAATSASPSSGSAGSTGSSTSTPQSGAMNLQALGATSMFAFGVAALFGGLLVF